MKEESCGTFQWKIRFLVWLVKSRLIHVLHEVRQAFQISCPLTFALFIHGAKEPPFVL